MDWENKMLSLVLMLVFIWATLKINAEYALCCPLFALCLCLTLSRQRRMDGTYRRYWIAQGAPVPPDVHRPVALLRVAVLGFRNLPETGPPVLQAGQQGMQGSMQGAYNMVASSVSAGAGLLSVTAAPSSNLMPNPSSSSLGGTRPFVKISYVPMPETGSIQVQEKDIHEYLIGTVAAHGGDSNAPAARAQRGANPQNGLTQLMSSLQLPGMRTDTMLKDGIMHNIADPWVVRPDSARHQLGQVVAEALQGLGSSSNSNSAFTALGPTARIVESLIEEAGAHGIAKAKGVKSLSASSDVALVYPLLQSMHISTTVAAPTCAPENDSDTEDEAEEKEEATVPKPTGLVPWETNTGIVKVNLILVFFKKLYPTILAHSSHTSIFI